LTVKYYGRILIIGNTVKVELPIINYLRKKYMPRMNGTGPMRQGAGTGQGLGPCGAGMVNGRRGGGRGLGWRRFWGYYPAPAPSKKDEVKMLSEEAGIMEEELKNIKSRIAGLKGQK